MYGWNAVAVFVVILLAISGISVWVEALFKANQLAGTRLSRVTLLLENLRRYLTNKDPVNSEHEGPLR